MKPGGGLPAGAVIGIVVGASLAVAVVVCILIRKKLAKEDSQQ